MALPLAHRLLARIAAFAILASACALAAAENRVALLIGNNAYSATPLQNAVNDARDLSAALKQLGFTTLVRENATRKDMIEALRDFGQAIGQADVAVFFYAGHALQFKDRNYLVPVDAEIRSEEDIALFAVEIQQVFDRMDRARTRNNVIILDACRDNPFAATFKVSSPGLAQASAPSGTLVAYATAPGSVAADGYGRNGIYTKNILQHITSADLPVEIMFKRVREGVERDTQRRQTPWDASSLKGEFSFNAGGRSVPVAAATAAAPAMAAPSVDVQLQIEREFWISARDSNRPEELQAYLDNYPEGKFVALARLRLRNMGTSVSPAGLQGLPINQLPGNVRNQARSLTPEEPPPQPPPARDKSSWLGWRLWSAAEVLSSAPPPKPTIDELFRKPQFSSMQLSPDGKHIAAITPIAGRENLVILDIDKKQARAVTNYDGDDVVWYRWLSSQRLLLQTDSVLDTICDCHFGGLVAVDIDGRDARQITTSPEKGMGGSLVFRPLIVVGFPLEEGDDFIAQELVATPDGRASGGGLYRVNSRSGRKTPLSYGRPDSGENEHWVLDNAGVARVFVAERRGTSVVYYRAGDGQPWQKLDEFAIGTPGWVPLGIAADGKSIYASSWKGRDKSAIVLIDPAKPGEPRVIASHPYVDVKELVFDKGVPVGISYEADRPGFAWFDEELERIQSTVDTVFPRATNVLQWSRNRERVLVRTGSDVSPGAYYLFDRATGRIQWLVDRQSWIKRETMSPTTPVRYKARDGLDIPAYLTLPLVPARVPAPLIVMVHAGPWNEGYSWHFDPEVQYLASRGYAVLQPNFRGTQRYGWNHFRASFRQWGRAMQDDLTDGVAWAASKGYVDANRVCVYGASYGGYAALVALATAPDVYKCAVNFSGFTDLSILFDSGWSVLSNSDFMRYSAKELIGDPDKERAALDAVSPIVQAARTRGAVLSAYGAEDFLVPLTQSSRLQSAFERAGGKTQWIVLDRENHVFRDFSRRKQLYEATEKFLAENLK